MLHTSRHTILRDIKKGRLRAFFVGGHYRIRDDDLEEYTRCSIK